jgi:5'-phosphate synthase pdxT subunit
VKIGVLALQGDVREHARSLIKAGATPLEVRTPDDLARVEALVLPGGESTTIAKLLDRFGLLEPVRSGAADGMPLYGTCAGMILMAKNVAGDRQADHGLSVMDITVRRNAYGRQVDSFETDLSVREWKQPLRAVFIRAPIVEAAGPGVEILARHDDSPVLVRQGHLLASSFHPEMTGDTRVHELFVAMTARRAAAGAAA